MNIGLVAHDSKKKLMQNFCIAYRGILAKNELLQPEQPDVSLRKLRTFRFTNTLPDTSVVRSSLVHRLSTMRSIWLSSCVIRLSRSHMNRMSTASFAFVMNTTFRLPQIWQLLSF